MAYYTLALQGVTVEEIPGTFANKKIFIFHVAEPLSRYAINDSFNLSGRVYDPFEFTVLAGGGISPLYSQSATDVIATTTSNKTVNLKSNGARNVRLLLDNVLMTEVTMGTNSYSACLALMHFSDNNYLPALTYWDNSTITSHGGTVTPPSTTSYGYASSPARTDGYGLYSLSLPYTTAQLETGNAIAGAIFPPPPTDPYGPGGFSGGGGGTGTFDNTSVPIDFPPLPTLSATDAGFITLFNPSKAELVALADYMWNNPLFDLDTWKKIVADPMDAILGLAIVPVAVTPGTSKALKIGNISTSVSMTEAARQFEEVDCGTLNIEECWGAYLDYDPYTKAELYLPYIGTHAISADDIMGKSVHIKYHVDILTGACCAYIKCGSSILYTFSGQCATSVPIASKDLTNVVNGIIGAAKAVGSMAASGGASAPSQIPGLVSTAVNALKPNIEKSGSLVGTSGMLATQTPYLILTRPNQALPKDQNTFIGYPSFVTATLGDLTGYTEVESIHPENIPATKAELSEIVTLLGNGVIF